MKYLIILFLVISHVCVTAQTLEKVVSNPLSGYSSYLNNDLAHKLDDTMDPGIAVSVIYRNQVKIRNLKGVEEINTKRKQLVTPSTSFYLASVTKPMTAQIILKLVQSGKVSLSEKIGNYLTELPGFMLNIPVSNLLSHSSGIPDYFQYITWRETSIDNKYILSLMREKMKQLDFTPGTSYAYSNSNYVLLALIIEKVTGNSYRYEIESEIFKAVGMNQSSVGAPADGLHPAIGYRYMDGKFMINDYKRIEFQNGIIAPFNKSAYGASGVFSTLADLEKYLIDLLGQEYFQSLPPDKTKINYEIAGVKNAYYGSGWFTGKINGREVYWHSGEFAGYRNILLLVPELSFAIVVLSNNGNINPEELVLNWAEEFILRNRNL